MDERRKGGGMGRKVVWLLFHVLPRDCFFFSQIKTSFGAETYIPWYNIYISIGVIENIMFYTVPVKYSSPPPTQLNWMFKKRKVLVWIIHWFHLWTIRLGHETCWSLANHHCKIKPTWQITVMCNFYSQLYQTM